MRFCDATVANLLKKYLISLVILTQICEKGARKFGVVEAGCSPESVCMFVCVCAERGCLLNPLGSLPLCPYTVLTGSQADRQGSVCQHSCLLRGSVTDTM